MAFLQHPNHLLAHTFFTGGVADRAKLLLTAFMACDQYFPHAQKLHRQNRGDDALGRDLEFQ